MISNNIILQKRRTSLKTGNKAVWEEGKHELPAYLASSTYNELTRSQIDDLENIPPFILIGLLYILCDPDEGEALLHFRAFTISHLLHTYSDQLNLPKPVQTILWFGRTVSTLSMGLNVLHNIKN